MRQALDLGPLEVGTWTVVADAARGFTCTIEVRAFDCRSQPATEAIVPTAVRLGDRVPVLLRAPGAWCGCTPRGVASPGSSVSAYVGLEVCGCSDLDPCVDPGYEATAFVEGVSTAGPWGAMSSVGPISTQIVYPHACVPGPTVVRIEPLGVDPGARHDSPVGVFARVDYDEAFCCAQPLPVAAEAFSPDPSTRAFDLLDCVGVSCLCDPGPLVHLSATVYLGQFPPGPQRVRLGAVEATFDVPSH